MKKKNLLFLVAWLLIILPSVGYAEITKKVDSFEDIVCIDSITENVGPFYTVNFIKGKSQEEPLYYALQIYQIDSEWLSFADHPLQMKITGKIYELPVYKMANKKVDTSRFYARGMWYVSEETVKRILEADSITIRVHYDLHPFTTLTIPSNVLNEWKQVIKKKF